MRRTRPEVLFALAAPAIPAPPGRAAEGPRSLARRTSSTAARRFLPHHAADHGIDPGRIGARGAVAGGQLALLLGTTGSEGDPQSRDPADRASSRVQAVACFFLPIDSLNFGAPGRERIRASDHGRPYRPAFDYRDLDPAPNLRVPIGEEGRLRSTSATSLSAMGLADIREKAAASGCRRHLLRRPPAAALPLS